MKNDLFVKLFVELCRFAIFTPIAFFLLYLTGTEFTWFNIGVVMITMFMYRFMAVFIEPDKYIKMNHLYVMILVTLLLDIVNHSLKIEAVKYFICMMMMFLVAYGMWRFDVNRDEERKKKLK